MDGNSIVMGIFIGGGTLTALYGLIRLVSWISSTEDSIDSWKAFEKYHSHQELSAKIDTIRHNYESEVKLIREAITRLVQSMKGKINDNAKMVGQAPAGPKKTS